VRAEKRENDNVIIGRPIVYDAKTDICGLFEEVIEKGALDETDLTDVRFLVNHNTSMIPLARSRRNNGNSTMKLSVDDKGMEIETKLDIENNSDARNLYSAVQRGDISGMSFMFSIDDEEWSNLESEYPTRKILKIGSVVEVSAVTWPAYEQTEINSRSKETLESARSALENARQQKENSVDTEAELERIKFYKKYYGGRNS
jgi:HK97 family phage prohead protease